MWRTAPIVGIGRMPRAVGGHGVRAISGMWRPRSRAVGGGSAVWGHT